MFALPAMRCGIRSIKAINVIIARSTAAMQCAQAGERLAFSSSGACRREAMNIALAAARNIMASVA